MASTAPCTYVPYFQPGNYSPDWKPVKSDNERLADAIDELRCVLEEIRDAIKTPSGPIITGIHALSEYRRIVSQ